MFEIVHRICEIYPSLNPLIIRKTKAREVFKLIKNLNNKSEHTNKDDNVQYITKGNETITRINVTGKRGTGGWI